MRARNRFLEKGSLEGMWSMIPPSNSNKRYDEEEIEYLAKSQAKNRGPQKSSPPELRKTRGGGGGTRVGDGAWQAPSIPPQDRRSLSSCTVAKSAKQNSLPPAAFRVATVLE